MPSSPPPPSSSSSSPSPFPQPVPVPVSNSVPISPSRSSPPPFPRSRSVQFMDSSRSSMPLYQNGRHPPQAGESSADEITPMVGRERGGPKGYDATAVVSGLQRRAGSGPPRSVDSKRGGGGGRRGSKGSDHSAAEEGEAGGWGGWWKNMVAIFGSVELDNKGSVARDHLALERTFLAWLRTSLAFASIGIAITQLFRLNTAIFPRDGRMPEVAPNEPHFRHMGKPLGSTFLGIAIVVLIIGGRRYFEGQYWIIRGKFPASRGSIFLISLITLTLIISSLVVVLVMNPSLIKKP